jgi:urease accessory protein
MGGVVGMGGPEMAPHTPPSAERSSLGLDRAGGHPATTGSSRVESDAGLDRAGSHPASSTDHASEHVVVITQLPAGVGDVELARRERDTLVLTAEERRWARRRVTTTAGRTLALALPTGSVLTPGAVLYVGPDWFVVVECATESCLAVTPASREEALRVAFEVGNRHFNLALDGERLLVPDDPGMDILLTRMNVRFERVREVFVPIGRGQRHDR